MFAFSGMDARFFAGFILSFPELMFLFSRSGVSPVQNRYFYIIGLHTPGFVVCFGRSGKPIRRDSRNVQPLFILKCTIDGKLKRAVTEDEQNLYL